MTPPPESAVSVWLERLKGGDPDAVRPLWEQFFGRLVRQVHARLRGRAAADAEDLALSAFDSVVRRAAAGRFPRLADRHDLWQVLVLVAARKAANLYRHDAARKRRGGTARPPADGSADLLALAAAPDPDPALAAEVGESCRNLLAALPSEDLRRIAVAKLEGYTNAEIAGQLGRSLATVERKLALIRKTWGRTG